MQNLVPKHKNYIHQMRENKLKLARKNPPVPTEYYGGLGSKPAQVVHTEQIKDTDVYTMAEQCPMIPFKQVSIVVSDVRVGLTSMFLYVFEVF